MTSRFIRFSKLEFVYVGMYVCIYLNAHRYDTHLQTRSDTKTYKYMCSWVVKYRYI